MEAFLIKFAADFIHPMPLMLLIFLTLQFHRDKKFIEFKTRVCERGKARDERIAKLEKKND